MFAVCFGMAFFFNGDNVQRVNFLDGLRFRVNHNYFSRRNCRKIRMSHGNSASIAQTKNECPRVPVQPFPDQI